MSAHRGRGRLGDEGGAITIIVALLLVTLGGSAALTFDLARLRHERHLVQGAVDLGSLAGAGLLPVKDPASATLALSAARQVAVDNAPSLASTGLSIDFACVVSDPEGNGGADSGELRFACGPAVGTWPGGWTTRAGKAIHSCNPFGGDLCNTIRLNGSSTIPFFFAPLIGFNQGSTGAVRAAACRGFCGQAAAPLDVVIVIDRSSSMTPSDIQNVKDGANEVLRVYDPNLQHVGLVGLPYHNPMNRCVVNNPQVYPNPNPPSRWQLVGLSSDYQLADGSLNPTSQLVSTIACLQRTPNGTTITPSGFGHTDLGDPMASAANMLQTQGRPDAPDVIIFFTDGEANQPGNNRPCDYANQRASIAKNAIPPITIFTLGYGVASARCQYDSGGPFANRFASTFLATAASPTASGPSTDDAPGSCGVNENLDGDYYFCESRSADLDAVFRQIAVQSIKRTRLLNF